MHRTVVRRCDVKKANVLGLCALEQSLYFQSELFLSHANEYLAVCKGFIASLGSPSTRVTAEHHSRLNAFWRSILIGLNENKCHIESHATLYNCTEATNLPVPEYSAHSNFILQDSYFFNLLSFTPITMYFSQGIFVRFISQLHEYLNIFLTLALQVYSPELKSHIQVEMFLA